MSRRFWSMGALSCMVVAGAVLMALGGCKNEASSGKRRIAVIPKGTTHEFWKSVEAGARQAGGEFGVEILWKGPLKEDDRAAQRQVVEQFISDGVNGIVVAPLDAKALVPPVKQAMSKKIPVVIFDSPLEGEVGKDFVSLVATDNRQGGTLGGQALVKLLSGKGKVVLLRYQENSASTDQREAGFVDAIKAAPEIKVLVDNRYAGATTDSAKTAAMNMLDTLKEADGIFCPNESSTLGMLLALRQNKLVGPDKKVKFVGFDTSPPLIEALEKGEIDALVAQNPEKMGYEAVKAMVNHLDGKAPAAFIDTGVVVITRDNLASPEVKKLLKR